MVAGVVLAVLVLLAGTLVWTGWVGPVLLIVASVAWIRVNKSMEGAVLWTVAPGRGLTAGDLAGLAGFAVALVRLVVLARQRG